MAAVTCNIIILIDRIALLLGLLQVSAGFLWSGLLFHFQYCLLWSCLPRLTLPALAGCSPWLFVSAISCMSLCM
nr:MAG TPA: hypothetical protein [Caudoviricetes sp.]